MPRNRYTQNNSFMAKIQRRMSRSRTMALAAGLATAAAGLWFILPSQAQSIDGEDVADTPASYVIEAESGTVTAPARKLTGTKGAPSGNAGVYFGPKTAPKKTTTKKSSSSSSSSTKSSTKSNTKSASSSASGGSAAGCTASSSDKLKDQDMSDTQHPWKVKTKGQKVVINFVTKGITGKNLQYMKDGQKAWNKSECIDVRLVDSCPSGGNCVNVKFNDGGGADGNYSEKVSGGFQKSTGEMEVKKDLSDNERKNVTIHEMGHAIGLRHVKTKKVMMNTDTYDDVFEPNENDYHNLRVLYGKQK